MSDKTDLIQKAIVRAGYSNAKISELAPNSITEVMNHLIDIAREEAKETTLPTDEEILEEAEELNSNDPIDRGYYIGWKEGAYWMRNKIKSTK